MRSQIDYFLTREHTSSVPHFQISPLHFQWGGDTLFPHPTLVCVLSSRVKVQDTARDLGVVIDSQLSMSANVAAVCRSGYYQLRQLRKAVRSPSEDASKTLVQAFFSCRLDYCNSLFFGISEGLMNRLHRFRTPPPVWLLAPDAPTTYRRCSVSYTGYL